MLVVDGLEVVAQEGPELDGEEGDAVFATLRIADEEVAGVEVDVFDAEARAFEEAKAGAIEELRHEPR